MQPDPQKVAEAGDPVLEEMVERLVNALHPDRIYLFGSRARGEAGPDSDYDLLVVVSSSDLAPHRRDVLAFRALCGVGSAKDVLVYTRKEFESRSRAATSLPATVLREGRLVYEASGSSGGAPVSHTGGQGARNGARQGIRYQSGL